MTRRVWLALWGWVLAFRGSSARGAKALALPRTIEGYCDRLSYAPGETVNLAVSTDAGRFRIAVARLGGATETVLVQEGIEGKLHPIPPDASAHGCRWPSAASFRIPEGWKSGYYRVTLTAVGNDGGFTNAVRGTVESDAFFVVRPSHPGRDAKILVQLSTNTYNAYCNWGGYSLYAYNGREKVQGRRVSFERPIAGQFGIWEHPFVAWAERNGYALDYVVNSDLEFHPELLDHYPLVLSLGHDEYWSKPMRDNLESYIGRGGNVAFFSGNAVCWQVRSEEEGKALACWKQEFRADPIFATEDRSTLTSLWSHYLVERPENQLTGVGFLWGGYHKSHEQFMDGPGSYQVHRPDHWIFEGTGLGHGAAFGGKDTIVGYECDGCELEWKEGLPYPTRRDGTPETFEVLATAVARWHPDDCEWYERWEKGRTGQAVMGTYTRGGTVFTAGTTDWSHGLRGGDPAVERITRNVLDRLSQGQGPKPA